MNLENLELGFKKRMTSNSHIHTIVFLILNEYFQLHIPISIYLPTTAEVGIL